MMRFIAQNLYEALRPFIYTKLRLFKSGQLKMEESMDRVERQLKYEPYEEYERAKGAKCHTTVMATFTVLY